MFQTMIIAEINPKLKVGRDKLPNYKRSHKNMAKNMTFEQSASILWGSRIFEFTNVAANVKITWGLKIFWGDSSKFSQVSSAELLPRSSVVACLRVLISKAVVMVIGLVLFEYRSTQFRIELSFDYSFDVELLRANSATQRCCRATAHWCIKREGKCWNIIISY